MTFIASLLLSWIAFHGRLINRDGILYLDFARTLTEEGVGAVTQIHELFFLPLLIALFSAVTPFGLETIAKILCACLLAGTCALMVDCVKKRVPSAVWLAMLVVLAMPAYNQYRSEILRENGFWFFSLLGFWFAMRWSDTRHWHHVLFCTLSILVAALFRLEAAIFFFALIGWQFFSTERQGWGRGVIHVAAVPVVLLLAFGLLIVSGVIPLSTRVLYYMTASDPFQKIKIFSDAAARMSETVFPFKYSREEAWYILMIGLLSIIPVKFLSMMGALLIPFAYQFKDGGIRKILAPWQPLPWAFSAYVLVLSAFVTHQMFLVGRYVSMLNLLVVPLIAVGLAHFVRSFPRWKIVAIALGVATVFANVMSTAPQSTQVLEASQWLKSNVDGKVRIGMTSNRFAYYAGWKLSRATYGDREYLAQQLASHDLDWVVLEIGKKDQGIDNWLASRQLAALQRFDGARGDVVVVATAVPR